MACPSGAHRARRARPHGAVGRRRRSQYLVGWTLGKRLQTICPGVPPISRRGRCTWPIGLHVLPIAAQLDEVEPAPRRPPRLRSPPDRRNDRFPLSTEEPESLNGQGNRVISASVPSFLLTSIPRSGPSSGTFSSATRSLTTITISADGRSL